MSETKHILGLSGGKDGDTKRSKYRKEKRSQHAEAIEEEKIKLKEESKIWLLFACKKETKKKGKNLFIPDFHMYYFEYTLIYKW